MENQFELKYSQQLEQLPLQGEVFPLVDEQRNVVGQATRKYCHSGSMALHPVVHLHIFNDKGELYLQKRSMKKDIQPGKWDTAVGGHVDYGESIIQALRREAREELGVDVAQQRYLFSYVFQSSVEREVVNSFMMVYQGEVHPDMDEVTDGRFWSIREIENNLGKEIFTPNFEGEYLRLRAALQDNKGK